MNISKRFAKYTFLIIGLIIVNGCSDDKTPIKKEVIVKHQLTPNEIATKNLFSALSVGVGKDGETYSIDATRALSFLNKTDFSNVTDEDIVFLYKYYRRVFKDIERKETNRDDGAFTTLFKESIDMAQIIFVEEWEETIERYKNIFHDVTGDTEERIGKLRQRYSNILK